jgi:leader peptidase (prepilin peptidase)/N-methyltransferase
MGFQLSPIILTLVAGLLGAVVGHFLNRLITHLPQAMAREMGQASLEDYSPLALRRQYPLTQIVSAGLSAAVASRFGMDWMTLWGLVLLWILLALVFVDLETFLLPDRLTLPLAWLGLLVNSAGVFTDLHSAVWGAAIGYLFLWAVYWLYWLLTRREGLGQGDFKLLAALGAWLGWQTLPGILLAASLGGVLVGVPWLWWQRKSRHAPIPFGPFIALAGYGVMLWSKGGLS